MTMVPAAPWIPVKSEARGRGEVGVVAEVVEAVEPKMDKHDKRR